MSNSNSEKARLRYQEKSCFNCKYYRQHKTSALTSDCLLLGRMLGINSATESHIFLYWDSSRVCDYWAKRPKKWKIFSEGVGKSPYWVDPYLSRDYLKRLRKLKGLEI